MSEFFRSSAFIGFAGTILGAIIGAIIRAYPQIASDGQEGSFSKQ